MTGRRRVIAVTGATGFLGAYITAALAAAGASVRVLTHRQPPHPLWRDLPVETVTGSVMDATVCARVVAGADGVVHAAGLIKANRDTAFSKINVQGTTGIAQATRDAGFGARFVLISSLAARMPDLSPYAASKHAGELAAKAIFSDMPEQLIILRPSAIYGPWDREGLTIFKAASGKVAPVFGNGRTSMMHIRDTANAITQVAMGAANAGCYALAGPDLETYTVRELLQAAAFAVGRNPRLIQVPAMVLLATGVVSGWKARLVGDAKMFTAGKARELLHPDWTVTLDEALPLSVSRPAIRLQDGFLETANWYKTAGWLP